MRFLFSDYSSSTQTECFYLSTAINLIKGCSAAIWNNEEKSAYDMFDIFKPDYFVSHANNIYTDAVRYMSENKHIKLILNTTGAPKASLEKIEKIMMDEGINIAFFYTNNIQEVVKLRHTNMICIPLGVDVFLNEGNKSYDIQECLLVNDADAITTESKTYHVIGLDKALEGKVDAVLSVPELPLVYKNYQKVTIKYFGQFLPQLFFDAAFYANAVNYDIDDKTKQEDVENKIKKILKITDINSENIKSAVKSKHTCLHRTKMLLSQLPLHDFVNELDKLFPIYAGETK